MRAGMSSRAPRFLQFPPFPRAGTHETERDSYNRCVERLLLTERCEHGAFLSYLYHRLAGEAVRLGGRSELAFAGGRAAVRLEVPDARALLPAAADAVCAVLAIGYKFRFLEQRLNVCLPRRERRLFAAALIAADYAGDRRYVRERLPSLAECAVDGVYCFRLGALREKWETIAACIPAGFSVPDLVRFCAYLAGESRRTVYVKGNSVYRDDFSLLTRSRLTGGEDAATEIVLSDAGVICCLGEVEGSVGDFLQKYYAQCAIFS